MVSLVWAPDPCELPWIPAGLNLNILIGALCSSEEKLFINVKLDFPVIELNTLKVPFVYEAPMYLSYSSNLTHKVSIP